MQAISDELLEILASRHQAGTRGYGCRVEIGQYTAPAPSTAAVRQTADNFNRDDVTAEFAAPALAGSVIVACLVGMNTLTPEMFAGETFSLVEGLTAIAQRHDAVDTYAIRIYARDAVAGETTISRESTSADIAMTIIEITGVSLSDVQAISVSRVPVTGASATFDVGTIPDALGVAVMVTVFGRETDQQTINTVAQTPGSGWTERADRGAVGNVVSNGWMHVQTREISDEPIALVCTNSVVVSDAGQGIEDYAGIAVLFEAGASGGLTDTSYQVSSCSIDKSRRMSAGQAEIEIPVADDAGELLSPDGPIVTNAPIRIYQWYGSPENEVLVFTGSIDEIREGRDPRTIRIVARDMLKRLIVQTFGAIGPQGADEDGAVRTEANGVYLNQDVDYIVNDILDRAGVPEDMRVVAATGYGLDEYVLDDGASYAECIIGDDALTGLTGYDLWADEQGVIHFESVLANRAADSDTDPTPDYSYIIGAA